MSDVGVIKIRIFGSHDCQECLKLQKAFSLYSMPFEFIDAMADENQDLCDRHGVEELPHLQAYREGSDDIILNKIGYASPLVIMADIAEAKEDNQRNVEFRGVRRHTVGPKIPNRTKRNECSGCKNENSSE